MPLLLAGLLVLCAFSLAMFVTVGLHELLKNRVNRHVLAGLDILGRLSVGGGTFVLGLVLAGLLIAGTISGWAAWIFGGFFSLYAIVCGALIFVDGIIVATGGVPLSERL